MEDWRVLVLALLACLVLLLGLAAITLPDDYEGQVLYTLDSEHAVRLFDAVGVALLSLGCALAWGAGLLWQRRVQRQK